MGESRPIPPPIEIENEALFFVPSFIYLGSKLSSDGSLLPEINRRRGIATSVMQGLRRPLWRHRNITRRTKIRIYNASVVSVLLYGAETWPMNKTLEARLDGFDSRALRQVENVNWPHLSPTMSSDGVLSSAGLLPSLLSAACGGMATSGACHQTTRRRSS